MMISEVGEASSIVGLLDERARLHPERIALTFGVDGGSRPQVFTYGRLHERACQLAIELSERATAGERAVLYLPPGPDYASAFLACLYAGLVAMPAHPLARTESERRAELQHVLSEARPRLLLATRATIDSLGAGAAQASALSGVELLAIEPLSGSPGSVAPSRLELVPANGEQSGLRVRPTRPNLSIVVPAYRSSDCLDELAERVRSVCQESDESYELILVNDCSPDDTWQVIERLTRDDPAVVGLNLRKNFGQDNALMAGLNVARGEVVIIMDDDLQHDPGDIPALLAKLREGYDVVYAKYRKDHQRLWKNIGSWFNGKVAEVVLDKPKDVYLSPYKAITAGVVAEVVRYRGPYPYVDGLLFRTTSRMTQVMVSHHARYRGSSTYTFWKSVAVWARLSTNFSVVPLRLASVLGAVIAGLGFALATGFLALRLLRPQIAESAVGWASIAISVLVLGGLQLAMLGVMGEYVGRMHLNLNNRPQYIVRESRGGL
ncbi:MAG TPA: glycosyltransferase [Polyangiaceae bacterium]|nr:glycosyltransferase [Polyangiaceae bacterium]